MIDVVEELLQGPVHEKDGQKLNEYAHLVGKLLLQKTESSAYQRDQLAVHDIMFFALDHSNLPPGIAAKHEQDEVCMADLQKFNGINEGVVALWCDCLFQVKPESVRCMEAPPGVQLKEPLFYQPSRVLFTSSSSSSGGGGDDFFPLMSHRGVELAGVMLYDKDGGRSCTVGDMLDLARVVTLSSHEAGVKVTLRRLAASDYVKGEQAKAAGKQGPPVLDLPPPGDDRPANVVPWKLVPGNERAHTRASYKKRTHEQVSQAGEEFKAPAGKKKAAAAVPARARDEMDRELAEAEAARAQLSSELAAANGRAAVAELARAQTSRELAAAEGKAAAAEAALAQMGRELAETKDQAAAAAEAKDQAAEAALARMGRELAAAEGKAAEAEAALAQMSRELAEAAEARRWLWMTWQAELCKIHGELIYAKGRCEELQKQLTLQQAAEADKLLRATIVAFQQASAGSRQPQQMAGTGLELLAATATADEQ
ncbi:hypothetical protein COO60DRAFT_1469825 [Scenedesmus sp. NREL 46B-D3]|nr:hypothetical protein COO60DRAFT_1469825 [Scenedesmus sp. NREL 46B-D3]